MHGQVSIEFLTIFIIIVLFVTMGFIIYNPVLTRPGAIERIQAENICNEISSAINSIAKSSGSSIFIEDISLDIQGYNYSINIKPSLVFLTYSPDIYDAKKDRTVFCSIITKNISSVNFKPCRFSIFNKKIGQNNYIFITAVDINKEYSLGETAYFNGKEFNNNIRVELKHSNNTYVSGYPKDFSGNNFTDSFIPDKTGRYNLTAYDIELTDLKAIKYFVVN